MRAASFLLVLSITSLGLAGCESQSSNHSRTDSGGRRAEVTDFEIDTTTTLDVWLKSNPHDTVNSLYPLYSDDYSFCRTTVGHSSLSNHPATRFAVFLIAPPVGEQLPPDTAKIAEQVCRLRTVWLETEVMDSATAHLLADSVTKKIDARLGDHESGTRLTEGATIGWTDGRTWNRSGTRVILAIAPFDRKQASEGSSQANNDFRSPPGVPTRKVVLAAYGIGSGLPDQDFFTAKFYQGRQDALETKRTALQDADSAIAWARLPSIAIDLRTMLAELRRSRAKSDTLRNPIADSALVRAVLATRDTVPTLDPPRRAAALIAAELVRYAAVPYPPPNSGSPAGLLFSSLQSIIAGSEVQGFDVEYRFNRLWLWQAYELDSLGKAGHIAFVRLLSRAFDQEKECAQDIDFYNEMIKRGEAALRRGDTDPLVHYYVGVAYKSIFDLGSSDPGDYVDSIPSKAGAESARLHAIEHFRVALVSLRDRPMRRDTWEMAARLLLRKPGRPWLFCASEYD
jgi:hypothetical protein